jgi:hypothetical protein
MATALQDRSLGELLKDLSRETEELVRKEVALAKAELAHNAARLGNDLTTLAVGSGLALAGVVALAMAAVAGVVALLDTFMPTELAAFLGPLVVGGALALLGYSRVRRALADLRTETFLPKRTTRTVQETTQWLKGRIQ